MRLVPALTTLLLLGTAACAVPDLTRGGTGPGEGPLSSLQGLTYVTGTVTGRDLVPGSTLSLTFTETSLSASAGCNHLGGEAMWSAGVLVMTDVAMTEMACADGLMEQDRWLVDLLTSSPTMRLDGPLLTIASAGTTVTLHERVDAPLVGRTWRLDGFVDGVMASSAGLDATLMVSDSGRLTWTSACGTMQGTAAISEGTLALGPVTATARECSTEDQGEDAMARDVLSGTPAFDISGEVLTLSSGDRGITLRADMLGDPARESAAG